MDSFLHQISDLSREQLLRLSLALREEILQLRPDEFMTPGPCARLLYQTRWVRSALPEASRSGPMKNLVLITAANDPRPTLPAASALCRFTWLPDALGTAWNPRALADRLALIKGEIGSIDAIVYVPDSSVALGQPERAFAQWNTALALACALAQTSAGDVGRLWLLTQDVHGIPGFAPPSNVWHAALNGLGKSMSLECPARWGGCIDVDGTSESMHGALEEIARGDDDEVVYRNGERFVPVVEPWLSTVPRRPFVPCSDASYLVTGGSGGIGRVLVQHLLQRGATNIVIVSRQAATAADCVVQWRTHYPCATVRLVEADVADAQAMADVIAAVRQFDLPLRGIFHAAGVNDLVPLGDITPAWIDAILRAKVLGALHLHQLTLDLDLDFQLYFSSIAGRWGTASMSLYAMASRFLDGLSVYRHQQGHPGCSIAWGPWAEVGMIVQQKQTAFAALGLRLLDPIDGLAVIDSIAGNTHGAITAVDIDWRRYAQVIGHERHLRPLHALSSATQASRPPADALVRPEPATPRVEHSSQIPDAVRDLLEDVLAVRLPENSGRRSLLDLGVNSLLSVELSQKITHRLGVPCRSTVAFDFPSMNALVEDLVARWSQQRPMQDSRIKPTTPSAGAVAIIGMACRLPGADSPQALWTLLEHAAASNPRVIQLAPAERFDLDRYACAQGSAGKAHNLAGGYLDDVAGFDHARFGISRREAEQMDPQQRLALETTWQALEQAGMDPTALADVTDGVDAGVFFGVGQNEYAALCRSALDGDNVGLMPTGQSMNIVAGRISHCFNFHGAAITYDTACSSSLVALDAAVNQLRSGRISVAVVGGVNALVSPEAFVLLSKAGALSRQGQCRAFDAAADGYVRAEGCVVLVLKRLADARADGNFVHAVIRGTAVNHDGRSSSLTAPNGRAQERVMRAALRDADIEARQVALIEAHGTGTPLGDPIEYHALRAVYADAVKRTDPLYLGTLKSFIGHTEAAAGLSGVLKLVLSLQHGCVPAQANFSQINPYIDATGSIVIPTRAQPLSVDRRIGAVSAFGFSGTNAHVIVEQGDAPTPPPGISRPLQRVHCWYTDRPLARSSGLAQAFASQPVVERDETSRDETSARPSVYVSRWLPATPGASSAHSAQTLLLVRQGVSSRPGALHAAMRKATAARGIALTEIDCSELERGVPAHARIVLCLDQAPARGSESSARILELVREQYEILHDVYRRLIAASAGRPERSAHLVVLAGAAGFLGHADPHLASVLASVHQEHPSIVATLVEVANEFELCNLPAHLDELLTTREPVLVLSSVGMRLRRLHRLDASPRQTLRIAPDRTLLLTGALGGIGEHLLLALLEQGARYVVNFNRQPPSASQAARWAHLAQRHGAQIRSLAVDVTDGAAVETAIVTLSAQMPPLAGVFHAAGVLEDGPFETQRWDTARTMLLPKFVGAWNLHRATQQHPLDYFVLFSSLTSLLGNANQAGYALANSLMDRLAAQRRSQGLPALSVQWGPWAEVGMVSRHAPVLQASYRTIGLSMFSPRLYLDALFGALADAAHLPAQIGVFQLDWAQYRRTRNRLAPYADLLHAESATPAVVGAVSPAPLVRMLEQTSASYRARRLREFLTAEVIDCLRSAPGSPIDPRLGFAALGIDSLHLTVLHGKLEHALGTPLPRSLAFDHPTIDALADFLARTHLGSLFEPLDGLPDTDTEDDSLEEHSEDELARLLSRELWLASQEGMTE